MIRLRRYAHVPVAAALILLLWVELAEEVRGGAPVEGDEVTWLWASAEATSLLRRGAGPAEWEAMDEGMRLGSFGNLNPPVGKYLIGAFLRFAPPDAALGYRWNFKLSPEANRRAGNVPPAAVSRPARYGVSVLAAATLALVYACALQITGARWGALAAPLLLFASGVFRFHAVRVYTDVPQLCLLMGAVVAFNRFLLGGRRPVAFGVALVLAGLSTAVKFSSAPLVFAMGLVAVARPGPPARRLLRGALAGGVPFAVFVAVNPYLYPDPIGRSLEIVSTWSGLYEGLAGSALFAHQAVPSPLRGVALVLQHSLLEPAMHEPAPLPTALLLLLLAGALAVGALLLAGRLRAALPRRDTRTAATAGVVTGAAAAQGLFGVGFLPGLFALGALRLVAGPPVGTPPPLGPRLFVLVAWTALWLVTGAWLALDWNRYYLRSVALSAVVCAAGVAWLGDLVIARGHDGVSPAVAEPRPGGPAA